MRIADPGLGSPDDPWEHLLAPPHPYLVFTSHEEVRSSYSCLTKTQQGKIASPVLGALESPEQSSSPCW